MTTDRLLRIAHASRCDTCRARILWALTDKGKRMPVNPDPSGDGNLVLTEDHGRLRASVLRASDPRRTTEALYVAHFSTCPNASAHRRPKRRGRANTSRRDDDQ